MAVIAKVSGRPVTIWADVSFGRISVFQLPRDFVCTTHQRIEVELVLTFQSRRSPFARSTAERFGLVGGVLPSQGEAGTRAGWALSVVSNVCRRASARGLFVNRLEAL